MRIVILFLFLLLWQQSFAQQPNSVHFWKQLQSLCGKAFAGEVSDTAGNGAFVNKLLVMHVHSCNDSTIRIPFFVGDDRSRTWVLTLSNDRILLKHDHRHKDGNPDSITMYGGLSTNSGLAEIQFFPADQQTVDMLPEAAGNIWWMTLNKKHFSYNLRRVNTARVFTVRFALSIPVSVPGDPWGAE